MTGYEQLLGPNDQPPYQVYYDNARSDFILTVEHGGAIVPEKLNNLGLRQFELCSHIALDLGIHEFASLMAEELDATLILQPYSRLVIDCNRPRGARDLIVSSSDGVEVLGNMALKTSDIDQRYEEIHIPFHREVERLVEKRLAAGRTPIIIDLHSFTPILSGKGRPWPICLLFNRDDRIARSIERTLLAKEGISVGINEPYVLDEENDFTIPVHAESRSLPCLQIEIRQDQLASRSSLKFWSDQLASSLRQAVVELDLR